MAKVLVTGGAGFLGSHLVDYLLSEENEVTILDDLSGGFIENINKKSKFVKGSICDYKTCFKVTKNIDIVFHLAAHAAEGQSVFCPIHNAQVNYIGSLNILVAAINNNVKRIVFTSSIARYGKQKELPMVETQEPKPIDPYGITKATFERLLEIFSETYGFEYVILAPHNIYGPRQNLGDPYRNVIGIWFNRIMKKLPPIIFGDGMQKRAFTYIDDVIPYLAKAGFAENVVGEVINIGPDENPITVKELAYKIISLTGFKGEPIFEPERPCEVKYAWASSDKARKLLGYKTKVSLDEGLRKTWEWARKMGYQKPRYWKEFEIRSDKIPSVWKERRI